MDLSSVLSNDQIAVIGCFAALATCSLVAALTYYAGPAGKKWGQSRPSIPVRVVSSPEQTEKLKKAA